MKALVKYAKGPGNLEIREVEEPKVSGDLVKIRVVYAGICGSDLHTWAGEYASNKPPVTLGHEFSGIVEEVGPDVKELKVGDRVTSETTFKTCGKCIYCKNEELMMIFGNERIRQILDKAVDKASIMEALDGLTTAK